MSNGLVITVTGDVIEFTDKFSLDNIYRVLDIDTFAQVTFANDVIAYVDDEGLLKPANPNFLGSAVFSALGYPMDRYPTGAIHGNVLLFGGVDDEGYEVPLGEDQRDAIFDAVSAYERNS